MPFRLLIVNLHKHNYHAPPGRGNGFIDNLIKPFSTQERVMKVLSSNICAELNLRAFVFCPLPLLALTVSSR